MKLYVGKLPNSMTEADLTSEFREFGDIHSLKIIMNRETEKSRGFGFIEMPEVAAKKAIYNLNDSKMHGEKINVKEALQRHNENRRDY